MTHPNVPAEPTPSEPSVWADIAAELRKIADDIEQYLTPEPAPTFFFVDIQPGPFLRPETAAAVDAVAAALLHKVPETAQVGAGDYQRKARGDRGPIKVSVHQRVTPPADERDDELARLRAENEKLRAELADEGEAACYQPSGFHAPEVIAEEIAACQASHPGRECRSVS